MTEKVWLVTGSSSGFGMEICKEALKAGDYVIATARKTDSLSSLKEEFGDKVLALELDVVNKESVKAAKEKAIAWKGRVDVLVNNAGIGNIGSVEETTDDQYRKLFNVNVFGLIDVTKAFLPSMKENKSGHVINFSSVAGHLVMPGFGPYCGTKHTVEAISEALATEVASLGIKVTIIEPGAFKTSFGGNNLILTDFAPEYEPTVGATKKMLDEVIPNAPGDPNKAAKVVVDVVNMDTPPLRLPLGNDAMDWLKPRMEELTKQLFANEEISRSTDF